MELVITWVLWMMGPSIPGGIQGPLNEFPTKAECHEMSAKVESQMRKDHPDDQTTQYFCTPAFSQRKTT